MDGPRKRTEKNFQPQDNILHRFLRSLFRWRMFRMDEWNGESGLDSRKEIGKLREFLSNLFEVSSCEECLYRLFRYPLLGHMAHSCWAMGGCASLPALSQLGCKYASMGLVDCARQWTDIRCGHSYSVEFWMYLHSMNRFIRYFKVWILKQSNISTYLTRFDNCWFTLNKNKEKLLTKEIS